MWTNYRKRLGPVDKCPGARCGQGVGPRHARHARARNRALCVAARGSGPGAKRRRPCPPLRAGAPRRGRDEGRPDQQPVASGQGRTRGCTRKQAGSEARSPNPRPTAPGWRVASCSRPCCGTRTAFAGPASASAGRSSPRSPWLLAYPAFRVGRSSGRGKSGIVRCWPAKTWPANALGAPYSGFGALSAPRAGQEVSSPQPRLKPLGGLSPAGQVAHRIGRGRVRQAFRSRKLAAGASRG